MILDAFAGVSIRKTKDLCREQYRAYMAVKKEWDQALRQESDRLKEMDFLRFEVQELDILAEFDKKLWLTTIDTVTVHADGRMTFKFQGGTEIEG